MAIQCEQCNNTYCSDHNIYDQSYCGDYQGKCSHDEDCRSVVLFSLCIVVLVSSGLFLFFY